MKPVGDPYRKITLQEYGGHSHQPLSTKDIYFQNISKKTQADLATQAWGHNHQEHHPKTMQDSKDYQHLNQKELSHLETEILYWKLLAPLNYKMLEGKYILVCPICDADLGYSIDKMIYERQFTLEALWGKKQLRSHEEDCKAVGEVNEPM